MKKLLLFVLLFATSVLAFSQGSPFPNYQPQGSATTRWSQQGAVQGIKGIINGIYPDTATANIGYIDFYPGAQIFTTLDSTLWLRNSTATKWLRASGAVDIVSFNFITDSSMIICFGNGVCDTIQLINFDSTVINIVNNFIDSSSNNNITFINDSTIIICDGFGSCDTISLGNTYNFYFLNDSTLVTCDTPQVIQVGDDYITQQLCDTISIPRQSLYRFYNGMQMITPGNVVMGAPTQQDNFSALQYPTYLWNDFYSLNIAGRVIMTPMLQFEQQTYSGIGNSVTSVLHGDVGQNTTKLYTSYYTPVPLASYIGLMGNRKGYAQLTNASPNWYGIELDDDVAKQAGIFYHVKDTANTDAVTIFGQQVPENYNYARNPPSTTSFFDHRISVFKTTGQVQFPQYLSGAFEEASPLYIIAQDDEGNLVQYPPGGITPGQGLLFARDDSRNNTGTNMYFSAAGEYFGLDSLDQFEWGIGSGGFNIYDYTSSGYPIRFDSTTRIIYNTKAASVDGSGVLFRATSEFDEDITFTNINQRNTSTRVGYGLQITSIAHPSAFLVAVNNNSTNSFQVTTDTTKASVAYNPNTTNISVQATADGIKMTNLGAATAADVLYYDPVTDLVTYGAAGISGITADNGLTANTSTNVRLGGTLLQNTTVDATSSYYLILTGARTTGGSNRVLSVSHTNDGVAIYGESGLGTALHGYSSGGGNGVIGQSPSGIGVNASSTSSTGVFASSVSGKAIIGSVQPSSTNTVVTVFQSNRETSGTAADGIGGSFDFTTHTNAGATAPISNQLISKWTTADNATRTSQLSITGVYNGGGSQTLMTMSGDGETTFLGPNVGTNGRTIRAIGTTGTGVRTEVTSGAALVALTTTGIPVQAFNNPPSTNTVETTVQLGRRSSGGAAQDNIGGKVQFLANTSTDGDVVTNELISKWILATHASRTSQYAVTGVINTVFDTLLKMGDYITLTESSATTFAQTTVGSGKVAGGVITVMVESNDGAEYQARTLDFVWSAANKSGTTDVDISTPVESVSVSSGTLTVTITAVDAGSGVIQFKANAVSSLTQTTLRCSYQISKNF